MKPLLLVFAALAIPQASAQSPRQRIRFDDGWLFHVNSESLTDKGDGGFRWSFQFADVDRLDIDGLPSGFGQGDWKETKPREDIFAKAEGRRYAWLRTDIGHQGGPHQVLEFDAVDDNTVVFLNGRRMLLHRGWNEPFSVPVRAAWRPNGPNTLVLLVENTGGGGGLGGPVRLEVPRPAVTPNEAKPDFDDECWGSRHLPHDYVVEGFFSPNEDTGHGSLPKPTAWYRKKFTLPLSAKGKAVWIDFDGVYRNSDVYLNGEKLGHENSGYIGFRYDLTGKLKFGKPNTLAVYVDPRRDEGWWYEGGGIYRHVWLNIAEPSHIAPDSVVVRTQVSGSEDTPTMATIEARSSFLVIDSGRGITMESALIDPQGKRIASIETRFAIASPKGRPLRLVGQDKFPDVPDNHWITELKPVQRIVIPKPLLWSPEHPNLYRLEMVLTRNGKPIDRVTTDFGIRTVRFDANGGFFLNGKRTVLKGTCNHQDHAGVGIAIPDRLFDWRIKRLKELGSNAYRCSHNPPAPELLDACDRLGMLVLDETRHLGDATGPKTATGAKATDLSELKRMIVRDRNHPSVFAWSLYNEEPLQGTLEGAKLFEAMRKVAKELDPTRLCTGASNGGYDKGIVDVTDLFGFNYNVGAYDGVRAKHPNLPLFGSETTSALSTRGEYANDPAKGYVSAYDVNKPAWGNTAEEAWRAIADRPYMAGLFVWTGFDYKGEPTPYEWPCINSHFGILDICGFPKDTAWYYKAWWGDKPVAHILPHWNWAGQEGKPVDVWVYSNADRVDLLLNGRSLGAKDMPRNGHLEWSVPYTPGTLEAVGTRNGQIICRDKVETTGAPASIRLKTDRRNILADSEDLTVVEVEILDAQGRVVPSASNEVTFEVTGAAKVGGVGNGDPSDHDPDKSHGRKAFHGLCMVLVQSNGRKGAVMLRAMSPGLNEATLKLEAR